MSAQRNEVIIDSACAKDISRLPGEVQEKLALLLGILAVNPFDPLLHTKPLSVPLQGMFSFRITRGYRIGFKFREVHVIQLLAAGSRNTIYERLRRKL